MASTSDFTNITCPISPYSPSDHQHFMSRTMSRRQPADENPGTRRVPVQSTHAAVNNAHAWQPFGKLDVTGLLQGRRKRTQHDSANVTRFDALLRFRARTAAAARACFPARSNALAKRDCPGCTAG
jgi:hypothetical protein